MSNPYPSDLDLTFNKSNCTELLISGNKTRHNNSHFIADYERLWYFFSSEQGSTGLYVPAILSYDGSGNQVLIQERGSYQTISPIGQGVLIWLL
jgi:hypothetical protein